MVYLYFACDTMLTLGLNLVHDKWNKLINNSARDKRDQCWFVRFLGQRGKEGVNVAKSSFRAKKNIQGRKQRGSNPFAFPNIKWEYVHSEGTFTCRFFYLHSLPKLALESVLGHNEDRWFTWQLSFLPSVWGRADQKGGGGYGNRGHLAPQWVLNSLENVPPREKSSC